jgi:hypothetical protein
MPAPENRRFAVPTRKPRFRGSSPPLTPRRTASSRSRPGLEPCSNGCGRSWTHLSRRVAVVYRFRCLGLERRQPWPQPVNPPQNLGETCRLLARICAGCTRGTPAGGTIRRRQSDRLAPAGAALLDQCFCLGGNDFLYSSSRRAAPFLSESISRCDRRSCTR